MEEPAMPAERAIPILQPVPPAELARYRPSILGYLRRLARNPADAEDLTQETFLRAQRQLQQLRDPAALEGWLYRIATNVCFERFQTAAHRHEAPSPGAFGPAGSTEPPDEGALRPDQLVEQNAMSGCVLELLAGLPEPYRTVLILHDLHGLTDPEIAARTGQPLTSVKMRLHRARSRLKGALSRGCEFSRNDRDVFVCTPR